MSMRWYVVHAYSGYEKKVAMHCRIAFSFTGCKTDLVKFWFPPKKWLRCAVAEAYQRANVFPWLCFGSDGAGR